MTAPAVDPAAGLLASYSARLGAAAGGDDLVTTAGARPERGPLVDTLARMGTSGLRAALVESHRFVQDEGITYGSTAAGMQGRNWVLDPVPVVLDDAEWARLEVGLAQRARLLDELLVDLYSERKLLRRGVLPPAVVLDHPEFIRQADGVRLSGGRQLVLTATDLTRSPDGSWQVLSDRVQAPSGVGYAMANRRIVSRILAGLHRETPLARLRGFFATMSAALQDAAPANVELPRVVLLSAGAASETAYDQAFLATLLGLPLVEADDLVMRGGRVWIRDSERLEPVDVILRRVDTLMSDPLELRADSGLGIPGLIEASRRGSVAVVNPIGTGVLENPALVHFLPAISKELLGEDLRLPDTPTWWCGRDAERAHVLSNLRELVVRPMSGAQVYDGRRLGPGQREHLAERIAARPWAFVAHEPLQLGTAPTVTRSGLEPRPMSLRTFAVAHDGDYHFLPGGLGRVARRPGEDIISNSRGARAKDVWVLSPPEAVGPVTLERITVPGRRRRDLVLAPRVADNLFWLGRYAERAEGTARLLAVADDLVEDFHGRPGVGLTVTRIILDAVDRVTNTTHPGSAAEPLRRLRALTGRPDQAGTVAFAATRMVQAAQQVRDQLSLDTWLMLSRLERSLDDEPSADSQLQPQLGRVLESLLAWSGIMAQSMVRDEAWACLDAGCRVERARHTISLVSATLVRRRSEQVEWQLAEAVLRAGESLITHRRRTASGQGPADPVASGLHLLLLDATNPRSVRFQLDQLGPDLRLLGDARLASSVEPMVERLGGASASGLAADKESLVQLLGDLRKGLSRLSDDLTRRHFTRKATQLAQPTGWSSPWQVL